MNAHDSLGVQIWRSRCLAYLQSLHLGSQANGFGCHQIDQVQLARQTAFEAVVVDSVPVGLLAHFLGQWAVFEQSAYLLGDGLRVEEIHQQAVVFVLQHFHHGCGR